eukprot:772035-Rhodomonas_salina.5
MLIMPMWMMMMKTTIMKKPHGPTSISDGTSIWSTICIPKHRRSNSPPSFFVQPSSFFNVSNTACLTTSSWRVHIDIGASKQSDGIA